MANEDPYMIIHDGPFYKEIYDKDEEVEVLEWLQEKGLTLGDMYLYLDGISYYNLRKI